MVFSVRFFPVCMLRTTKKQKMHNLFKNAYGVGMEKVKKKMRWTFFTRKFNKRRRPFNLSNSDGQRRAETGRPRQWEHDAHTMIKRSFNRAARAIYFFSLLCSRTGKWKKKREKNRHPKESSVHSNCINIL